MQATGSSMNRPAAQSWYRNRWPWLLMLGPVLVILAGIVTTWLAFSHDDALVVDDYYKQGNTINRDLRRDQEAARLGLKAALPYEPAAGRLAGAMHSQGRPYTGNLHLRLVHSTQPSKDLAMEVRTDTQGNFAVALPMLDIARWQVVIEGERRDWRMSGTWAWPHQQHVDINAG